MKKYTAQEVAEYQKKNLTADLGVDDSIWYYLTVDENGCFINDCENKEVAETFSIRARYAEIAWEETREKYIEEYMAENPDLRMQKAEEYADYEISWNNQEDNKINRKHYVKEYFDLYGDDTLEEAEEYAQEHMDMQDIYSWEDLDNPGFMKMCQDLADEVNSWIEENVD